MPRELVVLVCGSRGYRDRDLIVAHMRPLASDGRPVLIIHGAASGVDSTAGGVARELGYGERCYFADWQKHGRRAGPLRNQEMLDDGKPERVLAFWDGASRGTKDMISRAEKAGVPVEVVHV